MPRVRVGAWRRPDAPRAHRCLEAAETPNALVLGTVQSPVYRRVPAEVHGATPWVTHVLRQLVAEGEVAFPEARTVRVRNAVCGAGGIVTVAPDGIVAETLNCVQNLWETATFRQLPDRMTWMPRPGAQRPPVRVEAEGRPFVLLKSPWDSNYGHWLYDSLSRVALLREIGRLEEFRFVINRPRGPMEAVVARSLQLAGLTPDQVILDDPSVPKAYDELIIPGALSKHPSWKSPRATSFLEELARAVPTGDARRIYITRNKYSRRRLANEEEILPILREHGFVEIAPEELSFDEQMSLFQGAEVVTGNMGAAFTNLAFAPRGVSFLALATTTMPHDFFYDITCHKGGRYVGLQGSAVDDRGMASDFTVDPELFGELLEGLL